MSGCAAAMSWPGISLRLSCYRDTGHTGLHKDLLGLWWASTDNRSVTSDGLTRDQPHPAPRSPAGRGGRLKSGPSAGSTPAGGTS